jgi:hypothetical protein
MGGGKATTRVVSERHVGTSQCVLSEGLWMKSSIFGVWYGYCADKTAAYT